MFIILAFLFGMNNYMAMKGNVAFARLRKNYILDVEERDPKLVQKIKPLYDTSFEAMAGTQIAIAVFSILFGFCTWFIGSLTVETLVIAGIPAKPWMYVAGRIVFYALAIWVYWLATFQMPCARALAKPLKELADSTWYIEFLMKLFRPLIAAGLFINRRIFRAEHLPMYNEANYTYSEDEIRCIVEESHSSGRLNALENMLIKNAFDFFNLVAKDVMIPRNQMVMLDYDDSMDAQRTIISRSHHTRYPLYTDDKDHIVGFVHVKDFMEIFLRGEKNVKQIIRDILVVPEVMPAPKLLQLMRSKRTYLAVVVDEYGSTVGLVTMEDLAEELVGEIPEDMEQKPAEIVKYDDGSYGFDGMVILEDVSECLGIHFDESGSANTIGGRIFSLLERIPAVGDSIVFGNWKFTVTKMEGFRITRVRAVPVEPKKEEKNDEHQVSESKD